MDNCPPRKEKLNFLARFQRGLRMPKLSQRNNQFRKWNRRADGSLLRTSYKEYMTEIDIFLQCFTFASCTSYETRRIKYNESSILSTDWDLSFHRSFQTGYYWTGTGISFFEVHRPERETDHMHLFTAEIKNGRSPISNLPPVFMALPNVRQ